MGKNNSVKTKDFRKVIIAWGLTHKSTKGSHERWSKPGLSRPVIFQGAKKEIPEFILKSNLKTLKKSITDFFTTLDSL